MECVSPLALQAHRRSASESTHHLHLRELRLRERAARRLGRVCARAVLIRVASTEDKWARLSAIVGAIEAVGADFQILRVSAGWDAERYAQELRRDAANARGQTTVREPSWESYVEAHVSHLRGAAASLSRVYLFVSLQEPNLDVQSWIAANGRTPRRDWRKAVGELLAVSGRRLLSAQELEQAHIRAQRTHSRLAAFLPVREARGVELQWLVRRAFCRGIGEPNVDGLHEPRALAFEHNGRAMLAPLEGDVMRWADGHVEQTGRSLRIESELGTSLQAQLVMGAVPDQVNFPGPGAELMFAPSESLPFGVDLSLNARFLPNELALRMARRRVQDADQIARAELEGDQGVSDRRTGAHPPRPGLAGLSSNFSKAATNQGEPRRRCRGWRCRRARGPGRAVPTGVR